MRRFLRRNRPEVMLGAALVVLATAFAAAGMAGSIGNNTAPPGTLDTYANFSIVDTNNPAAAAGRVTKIDYYAGATLPMAFMVVSGTYPTFTVKYISNNFTPAGTGVQTFTPPATWMVSPGDNIGMYFADTGVIPFAYAGDPAAYEPNNSGKPAVGEVLSLEGTSGRTYSFIATVLEPTTSCSGPASSYAGFTQVGSTLFVPSGQATATVGPLFVDGVKYRVEAAGVFDAGGDSIYADAEYSQDATQSSWTKYVNGYEPAAGDEAANYLLDLRINGAALDWGTFKASHVYTHDLLGTGVPATFGFDVYDSYPSNNVGGLCVSVFRDAVGPAATGVGVVPDMVKVGSTVTISATIDDTGKGESWIAAAEWKVDGGPGPFPMTPTTALDSKTESFTATFPDVPAGVHSICVRGQDKAENWGGWSCVTLKVYDRKAKVSGAIVAHNPATSASWTDKGEPDYALEGYVYAGGSAVWGSISVNYKAIEGGPTTCTFTADGASAFNAYTAYNPDRVDIRDLLNSCDGNRYTFQLMSKGGATLPRGGFFISQMPGDYTVSTPYEVQGPAPLPFDYYLPIDRGNVEFWFAS